MIPHRRSPRHGQVGAAVLLAAALIAFSAHPGAAAPLAGSPRSAITSTRLEGQLLSVSGDTWLVDQTTVVLSEETTVIEVNGKAQVGAWVVIWGDQLPEHLLAELVHVLRPAGSPAPTIQFTGILRKISPPYWVIDDTIVIVDTSTNMEDSPRIGSQLSVTAQRVEWDLVATNIAVLAVDAASIPVEIEGRLDQIIDSGTYLIWVVDGTRIRVPRDMEPSARVGDWVEVKALEAKDGTLVAQKTHIVDLSREAKLDGYVTGISGLGQENQTWSVLVFDDGQAQTKTVQVSADTYVDEDRATLRQAIEAIVEGSKVNATAVKADMVRLEQPAPGQAEGMLVGPDAAGLWAVDGVQVWFESEAVAAQAAAAQLASKLDGGGITVVRGVRLRNGVLIAKEVTAGRGESRDESLASSATSIDATPWSAPTAVVPNLVKASRPTLLFGPDGAAHLVYGADGRIYHVKRATGNAWGTPQRIATGSSPSAAFDSSGQLHVAYVNEFMGNYDIYYVRLSAGKWTLPINASSTSGRSADPSIATDSAGAVHIAWMDTSSGQWTIHTGTWKANYWTNFPVSNARGQSPALAVLPNGELFLAWQDRRPTAEDTWGTYDIYASERVSSYWNLPVNVSDNAVYSPGSDSIGVSVVTTRDGLAHLAWISDGQQVRYNPGRGQYWPRPVDVGARRSLARGLTMNLSQEGMLNLAWDEGTMVRIVSATPAAQVWSREEVLSMGDGGLSEVSLASAAGGLAVAWVHSTTTGMMGIYESRYGLPPIMLRCVLPLVTGP